ncbi:hypothetical protein ANN_20619, partial [Periplaneta americana]
LTIFHFADTPREQSVFIMLNGEESELNFINLANTKTLRWAGHVARMGESRNAYRALVERLEGKRPLGRPRRRWEDTIKMDLREVGYDGKECINLAQDRDQWRAYVRAAMNLREELDRSNPPDAFVVMYSVIDKASFQRAETELARLQDWELLRSRPAILVGNKVDLVRSRAVSSQGENRHNPKHNK